MKSSGIARTYHCSTEKVLSCPPSGYIINNKTDTFRIVSSHYNKTCYDLKPRNRFLYEYELGVSHHG